MTECEEDLGDVTTVDPLGHGHDENDREVVRFRLGLDEALYSVRTGTYEVDNTSV